MLFNKSRILILSIAVLTAVIFTGCQAAPDSQGSTLNHNPKYSEKDFLVHYIDVGQGDSILIQINDKNLLIDAGPNSSSKRVLSYIKNQGVSKLDYIVATHPHEDHIGSMADIIRNFPIGEFYAPKKTSTTKTFENMVDRLNEKKLKINIAKPGVRLDLGQGVLCEIIAPSGSDYEDVNNYSAVVKINYGTTGFIFMGDAEKLSEKEIMKGNFNLSADVIKIGHHGSSSSSSREILDKVAPKIAVIMSGKGNDYGHPHSETLDELNKRNITVYRTDKDKDILLLSDGRNVTKK